MTAGRQTAGHGTRKRVTRRAEGAAMGVLTMDRTRRTPQVATPESLREALAGYERAYDLPSEEFLRRWEAGLLDDRPDYFRWYGVCHLALKLGVLPQPKAGWHAVG